MLMQDPSCAEARAMLPGPGAVARRSSDAGPPAGRRVLVAPQTRLYDEGAPHEAAFRLVDGCVLLSKSFADGRRQVVDILGPGRLFGFAPGPLYGCTAEARTFSEIERLPRRAAEQLSGEATRISLARSQSHIALLGRKTAREKVATALLDLARQFPRRNRAAASPGEASFTLYVTRGDLGDWLGLTVETVSRVLHAFRRDGLIAFSHSDVIALVNRPALMAATGGSDFETSL